MIDQTADKVEESSGTLLGIILDLSGSMQSSMNNDDQKQLSRIENVSSTFTSVVEDAQRLTDIKGIGENVRVRLFVNGFGFVPKNASSYQSYCGDIFSVLKGVDEHIEHYTPLQSELEQIWYEEIARTLDNGRITGDAKSELREFVETELCEQAISAEQQRSTARFQLWCQSVCHKLNEFDLDMREHVKHHQKFAFILMPIIVSFLWILKGPMLLLNFLRQLFENWLKRKLSQMHDNAGKIATEQSEKVVLKTIEALSKNQDSISLVVEKGITSFIDQEASKFIRLYDSKTTRERRKQVFDKKALSVTYEDIANQISEIMRPHADFAWKASITLFKTASRALKITPNWVVLKEKTILCAQQTAWEKIAPEVKIQARIIAKQRFTRAVLITIAQRTKDQRCTLSLNELSKLLKRSGQVQISPKELPIFAGSPMGYALNQTFLRLWAEASLPENSGLRPAIIIISDGLPTDSDFIDSYVLAENIKNHGIPIICCFVTNRNIGKSWTLPQRTGMFWPEAAELMFSMASRIDEWPQFNEKLKGSRFHIKKQSKLFMQINHSEYLQRFIEALLLPVEKETKQVELNKKSMSSSHDVGK